MDEAKWAGDLDDDCSLERYGMLAHVEKLDRFYWWFAISELPNAPGSRQLFNKSDSLANIKLTTGKMARAAAECVMESLQEARCAASRKAAQAVGEQTVPEGHPLGIITLT